ncbi:hypothetical protein [Endozoicomonas arenosclerae]|uniref:hypothetical protein n=1 Tax=Endozoicomonas arenosclerae TaxID=1633495 RepID=UPI00078608BE|nr:hypothetical protein [Endozoicomonas arenosclerae]
MARIALKSLIVFIFPLLLTACTPTTQVQSATLHLSGSDGSARLKPELFGSNIQWENRGDGILEAEQPGAGFDQKAVKLAKESGVTLLRFPGGSLSDTYDWQHGIGPVKKRPQGLSFSGAKVPSHFGTDELLKLSRKLKTDLVLTINFNWSDQHALEWIDYVEKKLIKNNKVQAQYWEIGNEIYAPHENGHTTAAKYAERTNQFARALKQRNPNIKVGAVVEASFLQAAWMKNVYPHMETWNEEVIRRLSSDIDFVSLHFYAPYDKMWDSRELSRLTLAGPDIFRQNVEKIQALLDKYQRTDIQMAVTEYNTFFGDKLKLDSRTAEPEGALFTAMMLFEMAKAPNILFANHWSLINNAVFGMINTHSSPETRPVFDVFKALATQKNNLIYQHTPKSPEYTVKAKGNIPSASIPKLASLVTENSKGELYINLVNRSPDTTLLLNSNELTGNKFKKATINQWSGLDTRAWKKSYIEKKISLSEKHFDIKLPPFSFSVIKLNR